jgi:hypothetical protein
MGRCTAFDKLITLGGAFLVVSTKYKTDSPQSLKPYEVLILRGTFEHRVISSY